MQERDPADDVVFKWHPGTIVKYIRADGQFTYGALYQLGHQQPWANDPDLPVGPKYWVTNDEGTSVPAKEEWFERAIIK